MEEERRQWSHLVGKDGSEAVEIIKKETGIIMTSYFVHLNIFSILFRFYKGSYCPSKFNGHYGLSNGSS